MPNRQFDVAPPSREPAAHERAAGPGAGPAAPARAGLRTLRGLAGNRGTGRLLRTFGPAALVQPSLLVGAAHDSCEREADRLADQVLRRKPDADVLRSSERPSNAAFDAGAGLTGRLTARRSGGRPIPDSTREPLENALGADFSGVRLHTDAEAGELSAGIGARAFTYGRDIYFAPGRYAPATTRGRHLLAHELTHVVQQHGQGRTVQRAVGFEFEDSTWSVFVAQPGKQFEKPGWFFKGKPAPPDSELTKEEEAEEEIRGENIWKGSDAGTHINNLVGEFNLQTAPKKGTLHKGKHYVVEPDGPYTDHGYKNRMDLEVVTDPFPETEKGYEDLLEALDDLNRVFSKLDKGATGEWDGEPFEYGRFAGPSVHGFTRKDVYLYGGTPGGMFKPQVTGGIRLADLPRVFATLGAHPGERAEWSEQAAEMRQLAYDTSNVDKLSKNALQFLQAEAAWIAMSTVRELASQGVFSAEHDLDELGGFLSLALVYIAVLTRANKEGIKNEIPLLSRKPMSKLWLQVPDPVRKAVKARREDFLAAVDSATKALLKSYFARKYKHIDFSRQIGEGLSGKMLNPLMPKEHQQLAGALGSFTRKQWLEGVMRGYDLLTPRHLLIWLTERRTEHTEAPEKYGKSIAIFLRGHGNVTNVRDVPGQEGEELAILENRNAKTKRTETVPGLSLKEIGPFTLQYFKWLTKVRDRLI